ncbi:MAG: dihydroneopterin aldolase [Snowella sp.]|jgi:dihydroneopterin aldolase|nr:dihydroneopterin aldolase [Snowella sp.]
MDTLTVKGIRVYGYTGYFEAEQFLGQWFEVDLTLWLDLSKAGHSDELTDTLNYAEAVMIVQNIVKNQKFKMIERLAEAIATEILETGKTHQVKVNLTKCQAPIPDFDGEVTLEIIRSR